MNIIVTGGSGFIGSHFIEEIIERDDVKRVYNIDCGTYAANKNLSFDKNPKYHKLRYCSAIFPRPKKLSSLINPISCGSLCG